MARASSRAGTMIDTKGQTSSFALRRRPRIRRLRMVLRSAETQSAKANQESACMEIADARSAIESLSRSYATLGLERERRVGELRHDPAIRLARLGVVALHFVRMREQHQHRVGRQH